MEQAHVPDRALEMHRNILGHLLALQRSGDAPVNNPSAENESAFEEAPPPAARRPDSHVLNPKASPDLQDEAMRNIPPDMLTGAG